MNKQQSYYLQITLVLNELFRVILYGANVDWSLLYDHAEVLNSNRLQTKVFPLMFILTVHFRK